MPKFSNVASMLADEMTKRLADTVIEEYRGKVIKIEDDGSQHVQLFNDGRVFVLRSLIEKAPGAFEGDVVEIRLTQLTRGDVWVGYKVQSAK